jgi:hypothetical protein
VWTLLKQLWSKTIMMLKVNVICDNGYTVTLHIFNIIIIIVYLLRISLIEDNNCCLQTFDVKLLSVPSGGAVLGSDISIRVGIRKSDSPNGIFSFLEKQVNNTYNQAYNTCVYNTFVM